MGVRLIRGFGSSRYAAAVLSLFSESRGPAVDRAFVPPSERVPTQHWYAAILLSGQGTRCKVEIANLDYSASHWLHNSGKLLTARDDWSGRAPRLRVSELAIAP